MLEPLILALFAAALLGCVALDCSVIYALLFGLALFFGYGCFRGCTVRNLTAQALKGVGTVATILINMLLIGSITALWRAGGTIPYIVQHATQLIAPASVILLTFLLCCLLSCLTGTAFGTAATMGVICMTMATSMGIPPIISGGAVLSGSYFGDRLSPMSTSALLVSTISDVPLFDNLRNLLPTTVVPFVATCVIYGGVGFAIQPDQTAVYTAFNFADYFNLHPITLAPALLIIILSCLRLPIKRIMVISIAVAAVIAICTQGYSPLDCLSIAFWGFHPTDAALATLLDGGGVVSMLNVIAVVAVSSCYAGLFAESRFLDGFTVYIDHIAHRYHSFAAMFATSCAVSMVACNQTLAIMLTQQLCNRVEPDRKKLALYLENSAVVLAPLVPWSIAGAVPLSSVGAPLSSMVWACFLYLLPLWTLFGMRKKTKK